MAAGRGWRKRGRVRVGSRLQVGAARWTEGAAGMRGVGWRRQWGLRVGWGRSAGAARLEEETSARDGSVFWIWLNLRRRERKGRVGSCCGARPTKEWHERWAAGQRRVGEGWGLLRRTYKMNGVRGWRLSGRGRERGASPAPPVPAQAPPIHFAGPGTVAGAVKNLEKSKQHLARTVPGLSFGEQGV
jgi:hypothetical protein